MRAEERNLQAEIMLRVKAAAYPVILVPVPNGIYIPARTDAEKAIVARIIRRLKDDGMMVTGTADLIVLANAGLKRGAVELKRPAVNTLFYKTQQGRLSTDQQEFKDRCIRISVPYAVCTSWPEFKITLENWGMI